MGLLSTPSGSAAPGGSVVQGGSPALPPMATEPGRFRLLYFALPDASIESSPVWDNSCLAELIYDLINRQFLCRRCPKPVTIQYLLRVGYKNLYFLLSLALSLALSILLQNVIIIIVIIML